MHLAGTGDGFLKQNPDLESVPLIITAEVSDNDLARQALERGAFDLITSPLDPNQTVTTVQLALWYNRLLRLLSSNEKAIEKYRQHMNAFPGDERITARFQRNLEAASSTWAAIAQSINAVHRSGDAANGSSFSDLVTALEQQTRAKAFERLHVLCREGVKNIQAGPQPDTTVLILDDDSRDLAFWATGLRSSSSGLSVLEATSIEESLDICRKRKLDCVVLDLDLASSSGFELLTQLIPDPKHPKVAVVILTRLTSRYLHEVAISLGARACLVKQWTSPPQLSESVQKAITAVADRT